MYTTVNLPQFRDAFQTRKENFSYEGLEILFEYLENYEYETNEKIELDVIALCCDYSESTVEEIANDYSIDVSDARDDEDVKKDIIRTYLNDNTTIVGETADGFIYQQF